MATLVRIPTVEDRWLPANDRAHSIESSRFQIASLQIWKTFVVVWS